MKTRPARVMLSSAKHLAFLAVRANGIRRRKPRRDVTKRWSVGRGFVFVAWAVFFVAASVRSADLEEQTRQIAAELRCPVCQNLSVADSPSELAQQMRALITEQLQQGKTPEEVKAFFVAKYGEWVLLAPSRRGLSLVLWVFPYAAAFVGMVAVLLIARRWVKRSHSGAKMPVEPELVARVQSEASAPALPEAPAEADTPRAVLEQERARIYGYLRELEFDYHAGKISAADYEGLRGDYEAQAAAVLKEIDALPQPKPRPVPEKPRASKPAAPDRGAIGFWRRGWVLAVSGGFILLFGVTLGALLSASLRPRASENDSITGDFLTGTGPGGLSQGRAGGRAPQAEFLALVSQGRAAFERKDWPAAIDSFKRAAELEPAEPEPHAYMGFILAQAGHYDGALLAFERALSSEPNFALALWGKGMLLFHVKKDLAGARAHLEKVLTLMPAGPERDEVQKTLLEINLSGEGKAAQEKPQGHESISGTVFLAGAVASRLAEKAVLFIIARPAGGGGPPLAVKKIEHPKFPLAYSLSQENVMMPGVSFSGKLDVSARLDRDGNPMTRQPGDLTGEYRANPVEVGAQKVDIVIDQAR
ncbi:MAG TPA: cytochrome c-type biogenesis protein CcmH [Candidatus Acidoferrales bacterium]|nr:cytochrome c-type biogenesis protein CcmH [Candidatus Acidoferrales bacterium]